MPSDSISDLLGGTGSASSSGQRAVELSHASGKRDLLGVPSGLAAVESRDASRPRCVALVGAAGDETARRCAERDGKLLLPLLLLPVVDETTFMLSGEAAVSAPAL
jgi:hypothetical protein